MVVEQSGRWCFLVIASCAHPHTCLFLPSPKVNALRREEERLVERLRGMEMTPAEEDTSRKRLYEVEWEIHDLMIRAPVFEFARDGAKIDDLRQSAKAVIASGSWSPRPAIGATTPEPVSGGLPKQEAHVEHAEGQSKVPPFHGPPQPPQLERGGVGWGGARRPVSKLLLYASFLPPHLWW